jgi:protein phosphatase-4 regulatory subunit 3
MNHHRKRLNLKSMSPGFLTPQEGNSPTYFNHRPIDIRVRPGQNRFLETEEEDYFNADDDEEDNVLPSISQQSRVAPPSAPQNALATNMNIPAGVLSPGKMLNANPNINSAKRRRRGEVTAGGGGRAHRPPLRSPRPLVDYAEDEDEAGADANKMQQDGVVSSATTPGGGAGGGSSPKLAPSPIPNTAGLVGGSLPRRVPKKDEDDEDAVLEALVRGRTPAPSGGLAVGPNRPQSPRPVLSNPPPMTRLGEKRRRGDGDDDDDELLSRLTRTKKQQVSNSGSTPSTASQQQQLNKTGGGPMVVDSVGGGGGGGRKNADDPPKKIKVKIGGFGSALAGAVAQAFGGSATGTGPTTTSNVPSKVALGATTTPSTTPSMTTAATAGGTTENATLITASSPSPGHSPAPSPSPSPAPSDSSIKDGDTG